MLPQLQVLFNFVFSDWYVLSFRNMRVVGMKMTKDMDLVRQHWLIKTHMKDCMRKENVMDKELTGTYLFNLKTKCSFRFISFFSLLE